MLRGPQRTIRHLKRYREIARVFIRHGLGELVDLLELQPYLAFPRRLVRQWRQEAPPLGAPQRLRLALEALGPTFIKLGQVLSTRPDLVPPAYIAELSKLQDAVPPEPWKPIRRQIEAELGGSIKKLFASFEKEPIAAASLAQVHGATLHDGSPVVVKVQRPDIEEVIEVDLEILQDVAQLLEGRIPLARMYDLSEIARGFATTLRLELDFYREAHNAQRFRENFVDNPHLYVPEVSWDFTTRRVLVMERISGIKIDNIEALDEAGYDRHQIAVHAAEMVLQEVLEDGFFHADPHPGNFLVMPDEVIGAMDFGMVGQLSQRTRSDLTRLYIAVIQMDEQSVVDQLIRMGATSKSVDRRALEQDLARLLRKYRGLPIEAVRAQEVMEDATPVAFRHHLRLPSELWLLGKTLAMMEGVALQLDPSFDIIAFSTPHIRRFLLQMVLPRNLGPRLIKTGVDWSDLFGLLPRIGSQLLVQAERGRLGVTLEHKGLDRALGRLDRLGNRISLSVLLAALIVGLALLIPAFNLGEEVGLATVVVIVGFVGVSLLGIWLAFSIWRSR
ncbi:MAG: AarF/ABC1/UbiB kinase family protein [Anaerolineae bacterium]|nr:AarF/ABC1/UbiB kinase family protein [Anaerolineae bacterium]